MKDRGDYPCSDLVKQLGIRRKMRPFGKHFLYDVFVLENCHPRL